jgi:two-component system OmpR family response regulator
MQSARVLVVDDERGIIEMLLRSLENEGHLGAGAENVEEAARALRAGPFDLVLLDNVLSGATGMQSLGKLRTLTEAPIYMMSGYYDDDTRRDAQLLGATGFLAKPLDIAEILALLAALPEKS